MLTYNLGFESFQMFLWGKKSQYKLDIQTAHVRSLFFIIPVGNRKKVALIVLKEKLVYQQEKAS